MLKALLITSTCSTAVVAITWASFLLAVDTSVGLVMASSSFVRAVLVVDTAVGLVMAASFVLAVLVEEPSCPVAESQ